MISASPRSTTAAASNLDEVLAILARLPEAIDFTRDGLADEVFDDAGRSIRDRFQGESGSEGGFAANRGEYGRRKRDRSVPVGVGLRAGGEMSREQHFMGRRDIREDEAVVAFGADDANQRKGQWFHGGADGHDGCEASGAAGQPPRPFFALTGEDSDRVVELIDRSIGRFLEGL